MANEERKIINFAPGPAKLPEEVCDKFDYKMYETGCDHSKSKIRSIVACVFHLKLPESPRLLLFLRDNKTVYNFRFSGENV